MPASIVTRDHADTDRDQGIEFGELNAKLQDLEFPVTTERLLEACGDHAIRHQRGTERIEDVLAPHSGEHYESIEGVRQALIATVGEGAIGRKGYADRDPPTDGEELRENQRTL